jgi:hypothetical protein
LLLFKSPMFPLSIIYPKIESPNNPAKIKNIDQNVKVCYLKSSFCSLGNVYTGLLGFIIIFVYLIP